MKVWLFRALWGFDAIICAVVVVFFFLGLARNTISSFNIGIWIAMLAAPAAVLGGGLWLKAQGHPVLGTMLLLILAIPGLLFGTFLLVVIVTRTPWN